jgi:hypothetical protein
MATDNKRYICSFVKKVDGVLKPNVVVIAASNNIIAAAKLCETYDVVNHQIPREFHHSNNQEGIKTIRLAETNTYEGIEDGMEDTSSDSES